MSIEPFESKGVIPNGLDVGKLDGISGCRRNERNFARMPLASSTWAITAKDLVRINSLMTVTPFDFRHGSATWRADPNAA